MADFVCAEAQDMNIETEPGLTKCFHQRKRDASESMVCIPDFTKYFKPDPDAGSAENARHALALLRD